MPEKFMRQIVLDTETTGFDTSLGNRIIEIGCVELLDRKRTGEHFHVYVNPDRDSEPGALEVHGLTTEFLADKPRFSEVAQDFVNFIKGAELVIHNAPFDVGFMDHEFKLLPDFATKHTSDICTVLDSLVVAKDLHPGQKNNLDALCKRYGIDNTHRTVHGALLDAELLAEVYLIMTGGQTDLNLSGQQMQPGQQTERIRRLPTDRKALKVIGATADELEQHEQRLDLIEREGGDCLWRQ